MNIISNNPISRLKNILEPKDMKSLYAIFFILLLSGIFETAGIASIIPFINILSDPQYTVTNPYLLIVINYLNLDLRESKVLIGISVLLLFIFINLFNIFSLHRILYFIARIDAKTSRTVLQHYLDRPYKEFVGSSPGSLTKHILEDASMLGAGIIYPLIQVLSKSIIIIFISLLLIIIDYKIFITSFLLLTIIYIIIYKNFTSVVKSSGEERVILNDQRYKTTRDVFNSLKEVKFYFLQNYYYNYFSKSAIGFSNIDARIGFLSTIPKYIIETIMFSIIFISIIYLIFIESPLTVHLPLMGVFILAAYRAVPMLQNVYSNINIYKLYEPIFELIEDIYKAIKSTDKVKNTVSIDKIKLKEYIYFKNISFDYINNNNLIKNLSFKIKANTMTTIIGSTGSGKTTLIDLLLGFYQPSSGKILIDQKELTIENRLIFNRSIGYVPQIVNLQENSLAMNIALGIEKNRIEQSKLNKIIDIVDLKDLVDSLDNGVNTNIGDRGIKLSGGQRQRVGIARALYLDPNILVLDESTNELDNKTENRIIDSIYQTYPNITIIMITHRLSSLKLSDNVLLLKDSNIHNINITDTNDIKALEKLIDTY